MDNINYKIHLFQKELIRKLSFVEQAKFNELLIDGLESEHMNYHLKKLVSLKFIKKVGNSYSLTDTGKDYLNMLDDNVNMIEKQPKTSVLLHVIRKNKNGEVEQLVSKRTIHPYKGKVGRLTGKVRFGETLQEAAERELYEETGLKATSYTLEEVYHKIRTDDKVEVVQDVLFYRFFITGITGTLIENTPVQQNLWASSKDLDKLDLFDDFVSEDRDQPNKFNFTESKKVSEGF